MLMKILLPFIFHFILVKGNKVDIIVKLDSKQIIDTLASETSMNYIKELAQVFAKNAAESFINEIKNKDLVTYNNKARLSDNNQNKIKKLRQVKDELSEEEALKLLDKPSPDGDNLGWHSYPGLEPESLKDRNNKIPVYELMKVNGVYVRRLLGHLD